MVFDKDELYNNFISKPRFHVLELLACLPDAIGLRGRDGYRKAP